MGRRKARGVQARSALADDLPASARVAWAYLVSLAAVVGSAGLVVLTNQTVAVVACHAASGDGAVADCKFAWMLWSGLAGFMLCLIPAALALKLDWWFVATAWGLAGLLLAADSIGEWWWWALALILPAAAALLSADWQRGLRWRRAQLISVISLGVVACAALVWWFLHG